MPRTPQPPPVVRALFRAPDPLMDSIRWAMVAHVTRYTTSQCLAGNLDPQAGCRCLLPRPLLPMGGG